MNTVASTSPSGARLLSRVGRDDGIDAFCRLLGSAKTADEKLVVLVLIGLDPVLAPLLSEAIRGLEEFFESLDTIPDTPRLRRV